MTLGEKLEVTHRLEKLRVDVIEAGFPASSKGDYDAVKEIANKVKSSSVAALSRAVPSEIEHTYNAIKGAADPRLHIFLATSDIHMKYKFHKKPEEILALAAAAVKRASELCGSVEFSCEDAMRSDPLFLCEVIEAVINAGATVVNVPDTVGYCFPEEHAAKIKYIFEHVPNIHKALLSVHCHNDLGLANANSIAGVLAGAQQVECTINGIGERAGNAPLEEFVMALRTKKEQFGLDTNIDSTQLYKASKLIYNLIGNSIPMNKPIVGKNAFRHESGIHQHGVMENPATYEILTPESVGIKRNEIPLGKHSGHHAFEQRLSDLGFELAKEEIDRAFEEFKKLCDKKSVVTDADIEALVEHRKPDLSEYTLDSFNVYTGNSENSVAVMRMHKGDQKFEEVSLGDGPVDAAYKAIDIIMKPEEHFLEKYSIHAVSGGRDTLGEALVKLRFKDDTVTGRGLSTDIIEASILAYIKALNKATVSFDD